MGVRRGDFERVAVGEVWRPNQINQAVAHIDPGSVMRYAASVYANLGRLEKEKAGEIAGAVKGAVQMGEKIVKEWVGIKKTQKGDAASAASAYSEYKSRLDNGELPINSATLEHLSTLKNAMDGKMKAYKSWNPFRAPVYRDGTAIAGRDIMVDEGSKMAADESRKLEEDAWGSLIHSTNVNSDKNSTGSANTETAEESEHQIY